MKTSLRNKLLFIAALAVLWQTGAMFYRQPIIFPAPADILRSLYRIAVSGELIHESTITLARGLIGAGIAFLIGAGVGLAMGIRRGIHEALSPFVTLLQSTPVISWILLALIWFDQTYAPIFIIVVATAPAFMISVSEGIRRTDPKLMEMASLYRVKNSRVVTGIIIPSILGYLSASVRIVFGLTYRTAVMAEVLAHPGGGIGEKMNWARINIETADIIAWTLVIVLIALVMDEILNLAIGRYNASKDKAVLYPKQDSL